MNDRPDALELLDAVARFLGDEAIPALSGHLKYQARVAANVVRIVRREIESEETQLRDEWRRLTALLGHESEHGCDPPAERTLEREQIRAWSEELTARIRAGDADTGAWREAVLAHLERTVADKLEVARGARPTAGD